MFNSNKVIFLRWYFPENTHRWSLGNSSEMIVKIADTKSFSGRLSLHIGTLGEQMIDIKINGSHIGTLSNRSWDNKLTFKFDPKLLKEHDFNKIYFKYSNARKPGKGDKRVLAMQLKSFRISSNMC